MTVHGNARRIINAGVVRRRTPDTWTVGEDAAHLVKDRHGHLLCTCTREPPPGWRPVDTGECEHIVAVRLFTAYTEGYSDGVKHSRTSPDIVVDMLFRTSPEFP